MMQNDLIERLFWFAVRTIKYSKLLPNLPEYSVIKYQLSKSATSSGANYEEAQAASSRADFKNKVYIALKEMRESNYWLRIIKELIISQSEELEILLAFMII
ncbi:MAG: four helix bundle protein [Ignavibacteriaceae bacterium]|nr:four helix bundle protein [Ignavibacteriaceae bacterium]